MKPNSAPASTAPFVAAERAASELVPISVRLALVGLRAYKLLLSPLFVGSCRFVPSCADYAAEAIRLHGVLRGARLAVIRLVRCQPF